MDHFDQLAGRHPVERIEHAVGVTPLVDLQAPGKGRRPTVEFLVEVVAEPSDPLGENDSRRDRVAECGQRYPAQPTGDPGTDRTERNSAPDTEAAIPYPQCGTEPCSVCAEIRSPVGEYVVHPTTDETKRHRPQRHVVDDAWFASPGHPTPVTDHQRGDDPGDDEQCVGTQRQGPELPDPLRRTRNVGEDRRGHAVILWRTPSASSSVRDRSAGIPSLRADTSAEPTMTPSA
ncbi:Uncharacterised protein [Mycolicibacterium vanbaalenii]|uniref:Uncharacterized protein n=1 Tax=Mycolicibacterium vanbaalenii TaxID=110539 RepID=A0A5S9NPQ5_MYCVN|nr:Uncharacterised protein [Mycolicibacterium vanbaalenii]